MFYYAWIKEFISIISDLQATKKKQGTKVKDANYLVGN